MTFCFSGTRIFRRTILLQGCPMDKVGLIINPHARGVQKMNIDPLEYFTAISEGYADIRLTNSLAEVDPVIKDFKKLRIPYIAVCGGDGTSHHVLSRMINLYKKRTFKTFKMQLK